MSAGCLRGRGLLGSSQLPQLLSHPSLPFVALGPDHHAKELLPQKKTTKSVRKKRRAGSTVEVEWIWAAAYLFVTMKSGILAPGGFRRRRSLLLKNCGGCISFCVE